MAPLVPLPADALTFLTPYLPAHNSPANDASNSLPLPHLTLTYASTLDAGLSHPGTQLALSSPHTKAMTHHLRTAHDAILVGATTACVDDPGLNSRVDGAGVDAQPRPVVLDPRGRWACGVGMRTRMVRTAAEGRGKGPWVVVGKGVEVGGAREVLEGVGGGVIEMEVGGGVEGRWGWEEILGELGRRGVRSVMVEGGAGVINNVLEDAERVPGLVSSVIVTVAPGFLGGDAVRVGHKTGRFGVRLEDVRWGIVGEDAVVAGRLGGEFRQC